MRDERAMYEAQVRALERRIQQEERRYLDEAEHALQRKLDRKRRLMEMQLQQRENKRKEMARVEHMRQQEAADRQHRAFHALSDMVEAAKDSKGMQPPRDRQLAQAEEQHWLSFINQRVMAIEDRLLARAESQKQLRRETKVFSTTTKAIRNQRFQAFRTWDEDDRRSGSSTGVSASDASSGSGSGSETESSGSGSGSGSEEAEVEAAAAAPVAEKQKPAPRLTKQLSYSALMTADMSERPAYSHVSLLHEPQDYVGSEAGLTNRTSSLNPLSPSLRPRTPLQPPGDGAAIVSLTLAKKPMSDGMRAFKKMQAAPSYLYSRKNGGVPPLDLPRRPEHDLPQYVEAQAPPESSGGSGSDSGTDSEALSDDTRLRRREEIKLKGYMESYASGAAAPMPELRAVSDKERQRMVRRGLLQGTVPSSGDMVAGVKLELASLAHTVVQKRKEAARAGEAEAQRFDQQLREHDYMLDGSRPKRAGADGGAGGDDLQSQFSYDSKPSLEAANNSGAMASKPQVLPESVQGLLARVAQQAEQEESLLPQYTEWPPQFPFVLPRAPSPGRRHQPSPPRHVAFGKLVPEDDQQALGDRLRRASAKKADKLRRVMDDGLKVRTLGSHLRGRAPSRNSMLGLPKTYDESRKRQSIQADSAADPQSLRQRLYTGASLTEVAGTGAAPDLDMARGDAAASLTMVANAATAARIMTDDAWRNHNQLVAAAKDHRDDLGRQDRERKEQERRDKSLRMAFNMHAQRVKDLSVLNSVLHSYLPKEVRTRPKSAEPIVPGPRLSSPGGASDDMGGMGGMGGTVRVIVRRPQSAGGTAISENTFVRASRRGESRNSNISVGFRSLGGDVDGQMSRLFDKAGATNENADDDDDEESSLAMHVPGQPFPRSAGHAVKSGQVAKYKLRPDGEDGESGAKARGFDVKVLEGTPLAAVRHPPGRRAAAQPRASATPFTPHSHPSGGVLGPSDDMTPDAPAPEHEHEQPSAAGLANLESAYLAQRHRGRQAGKTPTPKTPGARAPVVRALSPLAAALLRESASQPVLGTAQKLEELANVRKMSPRRLPVLKEHKVRTRVAS